MNTSLSFMAGALALGLPLLVGAQGLAAADAKAPDASLRYQSAFADYQPYRDVQPGDWKALNDTVRDGGDGQMSMGSMNMSHDMAAPMPMGGAHSMRRKKTEDKPSSSAPMQMHGEHAMPAGKP